MDLNVRSFAGHQLGKDKLNSGMFFGKVVYFLRTLISAPNDPATIYRFILVFSDLICNTWIEKQVIFGFQSSTHICL